MRVAEDSRLTQYFFIEPDDGLRPVLDAVPIADESLAKLGNVATFIPGHIGNVTDRLSKRSTIGGLKEENSRSMRGPRHGGNLRTGDQNIVGQRLCHAVGPAFGATSRNKYVRGAV